MKWSSSNVYSHVVRDFNFLNQLDARHNNNTSSSHFASLTDRQHIDWNWIFYTQIDLANQIIRVNSKRVVLRASRESFTHFFNLHMDGKSKMWNDDHLNNQINWMNNNELLCWKILNLESISITIIIISYDMDFNFLTNHMHWLVSMLFILYSSRLLNFFFWEIWKWRWVASYFYSELISFICVTCGNEYLEYLMMA